jgi:hypothetical protein
MKEIKTGSHFWAKIDGKLVMMMKDIKGDYFVCGPWEGAVQRTDFEFIEEVNPPIKFDGKYFYYL